jgi:hypothetical protein
MLEGRQFRIFTDHRPLVGALARVSEPWSARQQRQLSYISKFSTDIEHVAGAANSVADALSWPLAAVADRAVTAVTSSTPPPVVDAAVDLHALAEAQQSCEDCQSAAESPALRVSAVPLPASRGQPGRHPILVDASCGH